MGRNDSSTAKNIFMIVGAGVISYIVAQAVIPERNPAPREAPLPTATANGAPATAYANAANPEETVSAEQEKIAPQAATPPAAPAPLPSIAQPIAPATPPSPLPNIAAPTAVPAPLPSIAQPIAETPPVDTTPPAPQFVFNPKPSTLTPAMSPPAALAMQPPPPPAPVAQIAQETETPPPPPPPPPRPSRSNEMRVERSAVATAIVDRAPRGAADRFSSDVNSLYFFTHIVGATDTAAAVTHRWYREGRLVRTVVLQVRSQSWRTHSIINMRGNPALPEATGNWRVEVADRQTGRILETANFVVE